MPDHSMPAGESAALLRLAEAVRAAGYRFVTPTPATIARVNARPSAAWASDLRCVFGWSRLFRPETLPAPVWHAMQSAGAARRDWDGWRSTVRLSTLSDDLFLHSAYPTTEPDAVFFGPDTYRFCAAVAEALSDGLPVSRAADLCSGAGPGAVTVARLRPAAQVTMIDVNDRALASASVNAALAGLRSLSAVRSDLFSAVDGDFDLIVANPPYLNDPLSRTYRHGGGRHGEALSLSILDASLPRLRRGGRLVLYTGAAIVGGEDALRQEAGRRLRDWSGTWSYREIDPDVFGEELEQPAYADADRIAAVVLVATRA